MSASDPELLGQGRVLSPLLRAAAEERLHHCYVFEGPPQVGKATAAHFLARAAACEAAPEARPCGVCPTCNQMIKGNHPDLILLEPEEGRKSQTISVAQVREVNRKVRLRRYSARWRTVIIDPADALMPQAANALLKTLEEPPPGTGFVLITSRVSSLLATVLSRSQRVRFRAVPEAELTPWLEARGVAEAPRIARLSMGCPGKAISLGEGGLAEADAARDALLEVLAAGPDKLFDYAEDIGKSKDSRAEVAACLDALEVLLRDAAVVGAGRPEALINADRPELAAAWAQALWPTGLERLQLALDDARRQYSLFVTARLIAETLVARTATELGRARRAG
ncbi:MAG: DNA polymerase III subunit delta' [Alphaproteobacteria bacterium]|nr:DNA polymerase III subunit delta' [Alphaproteobacteria bacterium]MCB9792580.1 DNA polymerase III subunit delta' [Alphaproteobacteria bacterium]